MFLYGCVYIDIAYILFYADGIKFCIILKSTMIILIF